MEFRDTAMRARRNIERDKAQLNASNPLLGGGERVVKQPQSRACAPERGANPLLGGSEGEQNHAKAQRQLKADCRTYASPENKQPGRQDNPPSAIVDTHIPSSPAEDEERRASSRQREQRYRQQFELPTEMPQAQRISHYNDTAPYREEQRTRVDAGQGWHPQDNDDRSNEQRYADDLDFGLNQVTELLRRRRAERLREPMTQESAYYPSQDFRRHDHRLHDRRNLDAESPDGESAMRHSRDDGRHRPISQRRSDRQEEPSYGPEIASRGQSRRQPRTMASNDISDPHNAGSKRTKQQEYAEELRKQMAVEKERREIEKHGGVATQDPYHQQRPSTRSNRQPLPASAHRSRPSSRRNVSKTPEQERPRSRTQPSIGAAQAPMQMNMLPMGQPQYVNHPMMQQQLGYGMMPQAAMVGGNPYMMAAMMRPNMYTPPHMALQPQALFDPTQGMMQPYLGAPMPKSQPVPSPPNTIAATMQSNETGRPATRSDQPALNAESNHSGSIDSAVRSPSGRTAGEGPKPKSKMSYAEELKVGITPQIIPACVNLYCQEQMRLKKEREQALKAEREQWELKKEKEIQEYNPWGRAGGGAPAKTEPGDAAHTEGATPSNITQPGLPAIQQQGPPSELTAPSQGVTSAAFSTGGSSDAPSGKVTSVVQPGDEARRAAKAKHQEMLRRQIEEREELKRRQKQKEKEEEEREAERIRQEQERLKKAFEEEQRKEREKNEQARLENEKRKAEAEERRKKQQEQAQQRELAAEQKRKQEQETMRKQQQQEMQREKGGSKIAQAASPPSTRATARPISPPLPALAKQALSQPAATSPEHARPPKAPARYETVPRQMVQNEVIQREATLSSSLTKDVTAMASNLSALRAQLTQQQQQVDSNIKQHEQQYKRLEGGLAQRQSEAIKTQTPSPVMNMFERARRQTLSRQSSRGDNQAPISTLQPEQSQGAQQALDQFNQIKYETGNGAASQALREMFPGPPRTLDDLNVQQQALIDQQKQELAEIQSAVAKADTLAPAPLTLGDRSVTSSSFNLDAAQANNLERLRRLQLEAQTTAQDMDPAAVLERFLHKQPIQQDLGLLAKDIDDTTSLNADTTFEALV
eukprot:TRINITY_DN12494_c0_g1_i35.p1 TRINITY_DN12494_c0_g1~~TRINITY_DN12494_c0_g1_i35.p1  ORF type:complete len:1102 (+),score=170.69 TRINITY_DN12494_c0_g1_i35:1555-4860(+)